MTATEHQALEQNLRRGAEPEPLPDRIARIAAELAAKAGPERLTMTKEEIDAMWGCADAHRSAAIIELTEKHSEILKRDNAERAD